MPGAIPLAAHVGAVEAEFAAGCLALEGVVAGLGAHDAAFVGDMEIGAAGQVAAEVLGLFEGPHLQDLIAVLVADGGKRLELEADADIVNAGFLGGMG